MASVQHILVLEEDRATTDYIAEALGEAGYTVRVVTDRAGMVTQLAARQPDLLFYSLDSQQTLTFDLVKAIRFVTGTQQCRLS